MNPYSLDLRQRIVRAYEAGDTTLDQVAQRFNVSRSTVRNLLKQHRETGNLQPRPHGGGNPRAIDEAGEQALRELLRENNDRLLIELVELLRERYGIHASRASVARALVRLDLTRKKRASQPSSDTDPASS